ncbi:MAG TPA: SGNH/GDSL hydrolase family protein [Jatrophihabitantaceae bacterium]|nr:SGNH/GDSL hydrolase family protein [Jatrophihabitantaceae bacterium]
MLRSRVSLVTRITVVTAVVAVAALVAAGPASAAGARYVALGDSYASGVGSGSYTSSSGSCLRSTLAYSQLWANAHAPASYVSVACSGAKTTDVNANQLSALSSTTTLVSITIGGNDVGFSTVMEDCVIYSTDTCVSEVNAAENTARTSLPGWLDTTYNGIRSRSPNARVVVVDYPRFYHDLWYCIGLSSTDRNKINEGADVLDGVIQAAAARHGFSFADVRSAFANGHEICDSNSWLHSIDWSNITQSYHPTAAGQSGGYFPAFSAYAGS